MKLTPRTRIQSVRRETFFTPESAVKTLLLTPMPANSHFDLLIFMPEKRENSLKISKIAVTESRSETKNVVSSALSRQEKNKVKHTQRVDRIAGSNHNEKYF